MASSTFIALCQAQLALLAEILHLGRGVVYLAQDWTGAADAPWVPVLEYPVTTGSQLTLADRPSRLLAGAPEPIEPAIEAAPPEPPPDQVAQSAAGSGLQARPIARQTTERQAADAFDPNAHPGRLVLPLARDGVVLGLLVLDRAKPWSNRDRRQAGQVAMTLAAACELDRRNQLLEAAYRQQQMARDRQGELLHDWLHQFRNPLTAIRTFGKLVLKRLNGDDRTRQHVEGLLRESDRLQGMLTELDRAINADDGSDQSPMPDDPLPLPTVALPSQPGGQPAPSAPRLLLQGMAIAPWPAADLTRDAIAAAAAVAADRGLRFRVQWPDPLPVVLADITAWREVFSNLLDNAIKYAGCEPGDRARVQVEAQIGTWRDRPEAGIGLAIAITNEGQNIPPDDLTNLFQRGFRGVRAAGPIPGTGLGLAIARQLMEQMQGRLELFSPPIALDTVLQGLEPIATPASQQTPITTGAMAVAWLPLAEQAATATTPSNPGASSHPSDP